MEGDAELVTFNAVFSNDLLRELIIHHAIPKEPHGYIDLDTVEIIRSLRLVSKSWLESVSKLLRKRRQALFSLLLTRRESLTEIQSNRENREELNQVVDIMAHTFSHTVPTFTLTIFSSSFFRRENHESLSNFLEHCGVGLTYVHLDIPSNGFTLPSIFPRLSFPYLQRLNVEDEAPWSDDEEISSDRSADEEISSDRSADAISFIDVILNASEELKELFFECTEPPKNFELLILPSTITTLRINFKSLESIHLDVLIKNRLPNLTILSIWIPEIPLLNGLLFRVLDNVKETLRRLQLLEIEKKTSALVRRKTLISFPVMEKLERLEVGSPHCELAPNLSSLEKCLPKVTLLMLWRQTSNMFQKWTENSRLESVRNLDLQLLFLKSVDEGMVERIHLAFPNIRKLNIVLSANHSGAWKYIFRNMQQLRELKICVRHVLQNLNSNFWDVLLIGTTVEMVESLRTNPDWRMVELNNDHVPSIRMLKELTTLHLQHGYYEYSPSHSLISDLVFQFALLKMPKLNHLELGKWFQASAQMAETWRNKGRSLVQDKLDDEVEVKSDGSEDF